MRCRCACGDASFVPGNLNREQAGRSACHLGANTEQARPAAHYHTNQHGTHHVQRIGPSARSCRYGPAASAVAPCSPTLAFLAASDTGQPPPRFELIPINLPPPRRHVNRKESENRADRNLVCRHRATAWRFLPSTRLQCHDSRPLAFRKARVPLQQEPEDPHRRLRAAHGQMMPIASILRKRSMFLITLMGYSHFRASTGAIKPVRRPGQDEASRQPACGGCPSHLLCSSPSLYRQLIMQD